MTGHRALKLRCGGVGRVTLFGACGMRKLSLVWLNRQKALNHFHVQQSSLIRHGWTIGFNPKIVVVQNHNHSEAGRTRIEQIFGRSFRTRPERQSHRVATKVLRDTIFADRWITRKATDIAHMLPVASAKPVERGADVPMVQRQRGKSSHQPPVSLHYPDRPQAEMVRIQTRSRRRNSPLATILKTVPATRAGEARNPLWPRHKSDRATHLSNGPARSMRKVAILFQPMRWDRRDSRLPPVSNFAPKPTHKSFQPQTARRDEQSAPLTLRKQRPTTEQVWLKAAESSKPLIENTPNRQFRQPAAPEAVFARTRAQQSSAPPSMALPQMPDMNRLVDEVINRIDRTARNEQLRRGL